MIVADFIKSAAGKLEAAGIASARLDVLILLEDCLHRDRAWILANPDTKLNDPDINRLKRQLTRRANQEPLSYIRGFSEFYGRKFKINKYVLEPRPETETMIELLLKLPLPSTATVADVGTGSGCLGITAALELPGSHVDLYDIDSSALAVAKHNSAMHELHLQTRKTDLLNKSLRHYQVILANLPYVPNDWQLNPPARLEPKLAIFGGKDGLNVYRRLFSQLKTFDWQPKFVLTECLPPQHEELTKIASVGGFHIVATQDFIQLFAS